MRIKREKNSHRAGGPIPGPQLGLAQRLDQIPPVAQAELEELVGLGRGPAGRELPGARGCAGSTGSMGAARHDLFPAEGGAGLTRFGRR
jgi:hypothetical protein